MLPGLLDHAACDGVAALYGPTAAFEATSTWRAMASGKGEYRYFAYPLPALIEAARTALYPHIAPIANGWHARMGIDVRFPPIMPVSCSAATQPGRGGPRRCCCNMARATTIACIRIFMAIMCSRFRWRFCFAARQGLHRRRVRPDRAAAAHAVARGGGAAGKGDAVLFAVNIRPQRGARGDYRVTMRHGVSTLRSGKRHTLGIIFHDAA
jgi:hypothetical protein